MADRTKIEWSEATWNPVTGCTKVSEGCRHCYAEALAPKVFAGQTVTLELFDDELAETVVRPRRFTDVRTHPDRVDKPLHWRKPRRVFVNSMSDLFHEDVPDEFIDQVFGMMALSPRHTFQVLTKRPERMRDYFAKQRQQIIAGAPASATTQWHIWAAASGMCDGANPPIGWTWNRDGSRIHGPWPLPNVWLGVSCENQETADERIPLLLDTPAAVRFVSAEPLLGAVDFTRLREAELGLLYNTLSGIGRWAPDDAGGPRIDWIITGGESGPEARPCDVAWIRSIRDQCAAASVPLFVKQFGAFSSLVVGGEKCTVPLADPKGGDPSEWPEDLRVREWPQTAEASQ